MLTSSAAFKDGADVKDVREILIRELRELLIALFDLMCSFLFLETPLGSDPLGMCFCLGASWPLNLRREMAPGCLHFKLEGYTPSIQAEHPSAGYQVTKSPPPNLCWGRKTIMKNWILPSLNHRPSPISQLGTCWARQRCFLETCVRNVSSDILSSLSCAMTTFLDLAMRHSYGEQCSRLIYRKRCSKIAIMLEWRCTK